MSFDDHAVFAVKIAGATVYVYWKPDCAKDQAHVIFAVNGAIEVLCTHAKLDMDKIVDHVTSYLRPTKPK